MALIDVKKYYYNISAQYLEMKQDLADYDQACAEGHITEEQLEAVKADIAEIEKNYNRLTYIMYLLELPKTKRRKAKFRKKDKALEDRLSELNADEQAVIDENESVLTHLREELKKLK